MSHFHIYYRDSKVIWMNILEVLLVIIGLSLFAKEWFFIGTILLLVAIDIHIKLVINKWMRKHQEGN
jgi:Zn-dependent protease with chaperone function